jgi:Fe-S cluster biogenesis protein NfuA
MAASIDQLLKLCREVLAPLVEADAGELYLVGVEADHLTLHLAGRYAGCPGTPIVVESVIEPAVKAAAPGARVVVTSGIQVPEGASRIEPAG